MPRSTPPDWLSLLPRRVRAGLADRPAALAIVGNTGWLLVDKLARIVLGLIVGAWVARYLGPARFGDLAYVLAFIAFFQALAGLGADGIVVRDIAQRPDDAPLVLGTTLVLRSAAGLACWALAVATMAATSGGATEAVTLTAIVGGTLVFQAGDTVDLWFQSQSESRRTVLARLAATILSSALRIALILGGAPLVAFAWITLFEAAAAALGLAVAYARLPTRHRWRASRDRSRTLLRQAWPFMLSGTSIAIYMRIDQIMVKEMLGERQLGIYAAALPLSQVWHVIPVTLAVSLAPYVARRKMAGDAPYMDAMADLFRLFGGLALAISIPTALLAPLAVRWLYGQAYAEASGVLTVHVFSNVFIFLGVAQGLWLVNESAGRLSLYRTLIGAAVSVGANVLLIPRWGVLGAAFTSVLSQACAAVGSNAIFAPSILRLQVRGLLQRRPSRPPPDDPGAGR